MASKPTDGPRSDANGDADHLERASKRCPSTRRRRSRSLRRSRTNGHAEDRGAVRRHECLDWQCPMPCADGTAGAPRTTPVAAAAINGERYLVAGAETSDWVTTARMAG